MPVRFDASISPVAQETWCPFFSRRLNRQLILALSFVYLVEQLALVLSELFQRIFELFVIRDDLSHVVYIVGGHS